VRSGLDHWQTSHTTSVRVDFSLSDNFHQTYPLAFIRSARLPRAYIRTDSLNFKNSKKADLTFCQPVADRKE